MTAYNPRVPPQRPRPRLPAPHVAAPPSPAHRVYRWGQSNPTLAAASRKFYASSTSTAPPVSSSSTAPSVSPSGSVMPVDPAYDQQIGALTRQRDTTVSGLQGQRAATLLNYGYNEGAGGALTFDPNNPRSQAAQLKKRYDESRAQTGINMANYQLYSGAYQSAQNRLNEDQLGAEDALQKRVIQYLAGNTGAQEQARTDYQLGDAQALSDRLGRLANNPLYDPGSAAAGGAGAAPNAAAASGGAGKPIPSSFNRGFAPAARAAFARRTSPRSPAPAPKPRKPRRRVI